MILLRQKLQENVRLINYAAVRNAAPVDTISAKKAATASEIAEKQEAVCINIGVIKTALVTS